jgi:HSP20 family molecular chaperone IbpA
MALAGVLLSPWANFGNPNGLVRFSKGKNPLSVLKMGCGRNTSHTLLFSMTMALRFSPSSIHCVSDGRYSPRYNFRTAGEGAFIYEIALPGLTKADVEVALENGILTISSSYEPPSPSELVVGCASVYPFRLQFPVRESVVSSARMENGLLSIRLETKRDRKLVTVD